jgi:hypothetical protein
VNAGHPPGARRLRDATGVSQHAPGNTYVAGSAPVASGFDKVHRNLIGRSPSGPCYVGEGLVALYFQGKTGRRADAQAAPSSKLPSVSQPPRVPSLPYKTNLERGCWRGGGRYICRRLRAPRDRT